MASAPTFTSPELTPYPAPLPAYYTNWLYADQQGNPAFWDRPDQWHNAGRVISRDQTFTQTVTLTHGGSKKPFSPANTTTFDLKIGDGVRCLVYARYASVGSWLGQPQPDNVDRAPTQAYQNVWYKQAVDDGQEEEEAQPIAGCFGTAVAPWKYIVPFMWDSRLHRTASLSIPNVGISGTVQVALTFKIAVLFTGR